MFTRVLFVGGVRLGCGGVVLCVCVRPVDVFTQVESFVDEPGGLNVAVNYWFQGHSLAFSSWYWRCTFISSLLSIRRWRVTPPSRCRCLPLSYWYCISILIDSLVSLYTGGRSILTYSLVSRSIFIYSLVSLYIGGEFRRRAGRAQRGCQLLIIRVPIHSIRIMSTYLVRSRPLGSLGP